MTRKILTAVLLTLCLLPLDAEAQRGRKKAAPEPTVQECIDQYRFDKAEELLEKEIATLKRRRKPTAELEVQLAFVRRGQSMLEAVEQVTFIDSLVIGKSQVLRYLRISPENGTLDSYAHFFNQPDSMDCTVYQAELGDRIYFARPNAKGIPTLCNSYRIGNKWSSPTPLKGLGDEDEVRNYPFMLSDGITLYYGAQGPESFGGYDIFVSRYDSDTKEFLYPENVGMPFNSPANDYLLAIDEFNNLGWFVTDRNQPEGKACIYTFIPNETRQVYSTTEVSDEQLRSLAYIRRIADTQADKARVNAARQRLAAVHTAVSKEHKVHDFTFVINDNTIYNKVEDFRSPEAKKRIANWRTKTKELNTALEQLEQLRGEFVGAQGTARRQLGTQILRMEQECERQVAALKDEEKAIRNAENTYLNR